MMLKLLILSAIAIGAICQSSNVEIPGRDSAHKAVQNLRNEIIKVLKPAQANLLKAVNNFKKITHQLEIAALDKLDKDLVPLQKQLNQFMEVAQEKGYDAKKCQKFVSGFKNASKTYVQRSADCIDISLLVVEERADIARNLGELFLIYPNVFDKKIDNCKGNQWEKDQCYIKFIKKINKVMEVVPKEICKEIDEFLKVIPTLVSQQQTCISKSLAEAIQTAENNVNEFGVCAIID